MSVEVIETVTILPSLKKVKRAFEKKETTIVFTTETGSAYTLVARSGGVFVIKDKTGRVSKGTNVVVHEGRTQLRRGRKVLWESTGEVSGIADFTVAEKK